MKKMLKGVSVLAALLTLALPGAAQAQEKPVWGLQAYGDVCRVKFGQKQVGQGARRLIRVDGKCNAANFFSYKMNGQNQVFFYNKRNVLLGSVQKRADGSWQGLIHDGDPLQMVFFGNANNAQTKPNTQQQAANGAVGRCVTYYGSRNCARAEDLTYKSFDTFALQVLAPLNFRSFPDLNGSIQSVLPDNICFQEVTHCTVSHLKKETWCRVEFNNRSGWILQKDANHVYASKGCG